MEQILLNILDPASTVLTALIQLVLWIIYVFTGLFAWQMVQGLLTRKKSLKVEVISILPLILALILLRFPPL